MQLQPRSFWTSCDHRCLHARTPPQHAHTQRLLGWLLVLGRPLLLLLLLLLMCACAWQHGCGPHLLAQRWHPAVPHSQAQGSASGHGCCGLGCQTPPLAPRAAAHHSPPPPPPPLRQGLCWCWMMVCAGAG